MKMTSAWLTLLAATLPGLLTACSSRPPAPDWQMNAQDSIQRFEAAYLNGDAAIEAAEWQRARAQIARTGNIGLIARTELIRCATRVASLVFEECAGFERLRQDAGAPERAYAAYLAGRARPQDVALLPAAHRVAAAAISDTAAAAPNASATSLTASAASPTAAPLTASAASDTAAATAVQGIGDPLAQLVAAGALLRAGRATPTLIALAADTASAQGWRRPLLAWLGVQAMRAEQGGATAEAQRIRRRIDLVQGAGGQ